MAEWYIIHASAGSENRVASEIKVQFEKEGKLDLLKEVVVPKKTITTIRRGVKVQVEDRILPGYILVLMDCTLESLHIIRGVPRVIGILNADAQGKPQPLSQEEVSRLMDQLETINKAPHQHTKFEPGEVVKVSEGLFSSMEGVVEEVDFNRLRLKISICILGRPTPVDLKFSQVTKVI